MRSEDYIAQLDGVQWMLDWEDPRNPASSVSETGRLGMEIHVTRRREHHIRLEDRFKPTRETNATGAAETESQECVSQGIEKGWHETWDGIGKKKGR